MAQKQRVKPIGAADEVAERIGRSLAKGQIKQALKDAKAAFAARPDERIRIVLEQASVARARELLRDGLEPQAKAVVHDLLALGAAQPATQTAIAELTLSLGMLSAFERCFAQTSDPQWRAGLINGAADIAVARGLTEAQLPADVRAEAAAVQRALALVEEDQPAEALSLLKDIPRQSPWSDWKLFVRGWIAFRHGETAEAEANWQRLAPERLAHRAARALERMTAPANGAAADSRAVSAWMNDAAQRHPQGPLLADLAALRNHIAREDWPRAMELLRRAEPRWRQIDAAIAARVNKAVYYTLVQKGHGDVLEKWSQWGTPVALDPNWNRALALISEHPDEFDLAQADHSWSCYVYDLAMPGELPPPERALAQALVWHHLGELYASESPEEDDPFPNLGGGDFNSAWQNRAVECFECALKLAPDLLPAHQTLADARADWGQTELAVQAHRALLARFPEHVPSLEFIANELSSRDEPLPAREYVRRAQRLKPLDRQLAGLAWIIHIGAARHFALAGEWEAGRREFAEAERFAENAPDPFYTAVRRGIFELRAGDFEAAEGWFSQATACLQDPAPVYLMQGIEARRYGLTKTAVNGFRKTWRAAAKQPASSESVGLICQLMCGYLALEVEYPDRTKDYSEVVSYLRRNVKLELSASDLRDACLLLMDDPKQAKLLKQLIKKGCTEHRQVAFFAYAEGEFELNRGPFACNRHVARRALDRALHLAEDSQDPTDQSLRELIQQRLDFLDNVGMVRPAMTDFASSMPESDMKRIFESMCEQLGVDPEDAMQELDDLSKQAHAQRRQ